MSTSFSLVLIAMTGGLAVTIQGQMMGLMDRNIGTLESIFITYAVGGVLIALLMLFYRGGNLAQWQQLPWWVFLSGLLGLVIVGSIGYSIGQMGVVSAFILIMAVQFIAAALIDHFGLFGAQIRTLGLSKLRGISTMMLGVWLTLR
jgi:transporter family-2 protein